LNQFNELVMNQCAPFCPAAGPRWQWVLAPLCNMQMWVYQHFILRKSHMSKDEMILNIDDEPYSVAKVHEMTPNQILVVANMDATTHYLVEIQGVHRTTYENKGNEPIKVHPNAKYSSVFTGATGVS